MNEIAWIGITIAVILAATVAAYFYLAQKDGDK